VLGKAPTVAVVQRDGNAFAFAERCGHCIGNTTAVLCYGGNSINQDQDIRPCTNPLFGTVFVEANYGAVHLCPHESSGTQLRGDFDLGSLGGFWQRECHDDRIV